MRRGFSNLGIELNHSWQRTTGKALVRDHVIFVRNGAFLQRENNIGAAGARRNDEAARHLDLDFANLGSGEGVFELDGKRRTFANVVHQCRAETSDAGSGLVANAGIDDAS